MGGGGGGRLFEAGRLLSFSAFRMGAYSRWALIRGWALIRINTVNGKRPLLQLFSLVEAITRPGYQASEATNATDEFFIIVKPGGSTLL